MEQILNVIIYYDNQEEVESYILSTVLASKGLVDFFLVVNKDEKKLFISMIEKLNDKGVYNLDFCDYHSNIGYLNALLMSLPKIDINKYKYVILSNTDINYRTNNFFDLLISKEYNEDIGCIAPSIYSFANKSYSNPHYTERIPLRKLNRLIWIFSHPHIGSLYLKLASFKASKRKIEPSSCFIYSPHGCYMIFTKPFIININGYLYGAKMYSEESFIGELLRKNNQKCFYDQELKINHIESTITGKMKNTKRFKYWSESLLYIKNEFY